MNEDLRRRYVRDLLVDLEQVGGARLEQWLRPLWEQLAGGPVQARGLNPQGAPVRSSLDAYWPDGSVSEASSDAKYFVKPYNKLRNDLRHAFEASRGVRTVRLFTTQVAGPLAWTLYERANRKMRSRGYELDLWDGTRIAEYIVDHLLVDDRYVTRVSDALPNLQRIAEQNAISNRVPKLAQTYGGRDAEEADMHDRLARSKVVVISGFGGIGKTELACAIAHRNHDAYEQIIWVDGAKLVNVAELGAYDVRLNGYHLNILNLLASNRTLLVLDNVQVDLEAEQLETVCGEGSRVLITSQVAFGTNLLPLGFVTDERAREILSQGMSQHCPDDVLSSVLSSVEGHPLVLRMLNEIGKARGGWTAIISACEHVAGLPDERRKTVADRILSQHLDVLGEELSVFNWCGGAAVDAALFEYIVGIVGIDKLDRWSLTARGQSDAIRLHDLVFASIGRVRARIAIDNEKLERRLKEFLVDNIAPKRLQFFRVANRHASLIERLLTASPQPGVLRYAYLHSRLPRVLNPALLGSPELDVERGCQEPHRAWALSIVEAIEADYRRARDLGDKAGARATLQARLPTFDRLIGNLDLPDEVRIIAQHHKAKSLVKLGDIAGALEIFERLIIEHPTLYASKLQVARLLETDPERAKNLIFEIIEAERSHPGVVATSVLIETLSTLRRKHLRYFVKEMTERYGSFMAAQLKAAACLGEDQPIRAFAAIGPEWSYNWPELFLEVLEEIEVGQPSDAEDDEERVALGRVLCAAGKMLLRNEQAADARLRFEQADAFFSQLVRAPTPFARTHHADVLLKLHRLADAARILDSVPAEKQDTFWNLRRAEAYLEMRELPQALDAIDKGIESCPRDFRSTFLSVRADVLHAMGNSEHLTFLRQAIDCCETHRYRAELEEKFQARLQDNHLLSS